MHSSKIDMRNMMKSYKQESQKQTNQPDEYSYYGDQKLKKTDYIKHTSSKNLEDLPHYAIKTHPLLATINKTNKDSSDLPNNKSNNTIKSYVDKEPIKQSSKQKSNYYPNEDEGDFYNFDDELDASQNMKLNESFDSCVNNNQNNNNKYKQAPFKLLSRTDSSNEDNNGDSSYNHCSSEVRKKFQRANRVFYNGMLNKQDKASTLAEYQAHAAELLQFLKSLWQTNKMCDLFIYVGNKKYSAHKLGLAMFSRKYSEEFTKQQIQNKNGSFTIVLKNSSRLALEDILKYIYTGKIDINPSNVEEILECAKELGIDDLICMSKDYLSSLSMGDILDFMSNTLGKDGSDLMFYELYCYLMTHLDKVTRTPEYGKSSISTVKALLNDSHLAVNSELEVFDAAVRWINFDKSRQKYLAEIMKTVRFTLMSPDELVSKVECQSTIATEPDIQKMLYNAYKFHALTSTRSNLNGICQKEELRNFRLKGASVPDEFVKAVRELSEIAHKLKENRNYASSNLINCDDSDDCMGTRCKPMKNIFNFNNNNNNDYKSNDEVIYKNKYEELTKKISKAITNESDIDNKCSRCKVKNKQI